MNYGLPYMGSKNSIAEWVLSFLPKAENFYDLFCGGCAITHAALLTNKFKHFHANDINPMSSLFLDAISGKYHNETRWISREEFFEKKDSDPYIAFVWSFGNNCDDYIYGERIEEVKHALWDAVMFNDYTLADKMNIPFKRSKYKDIKQRRIDIMRHWKKYGNKTIDSRMELERLQSLQSLERLERLVSLQSLQSLQSLERLQMTHVSYDDVKIKPNSVIYCDIPYRGTHEYVVGGFDYERFYAWAKRQTEPTIISEYAMPDDFECIAQKKKTNLMAAAGAKKGVEKLFAPKHQADMIREKLGLQ